MLCQNCKQRQATVNHITTINGKKCSYHLCEECASSLFGSFEESFLNGVAEGLFDEPAPRDRRCPVCGASFSDYKRTGLLGCPSCYDVFHEEILPYIAKIQGKTVHVGRYGGENTAERDELVALAGLQTEMEEALARGDYVSAEKINRKMNAIRKGNSGNFKKRDGGDWQW